MPSDRHEDLPDNVKLVRELQREKRLRQQHRREVFWARLPKFFIPGGIAALMFGLFLAFKSYQRMPMPGWLWTLFTFSMPGIVILLIGIIVLIWQLIKPDRRKSK
jgi:hypothetical protein